MVIGLMMEMHCHESNCFISFIRVGDKWWYGDGSRDDDNIDGDCNIAINIKVVLEMAKVVEVMVELIAIARDSVRGDCGSNGNKIIDYPLHRLSDICCFGF